jgi:hypothetical protein
MQVVRLRYACRARSYTAAVCKAKAHNAGSCHPGLAVGGIEGLKHVFATWNLTELAVDAYSTGGAEDWLKPGVRLR